MPTTAEQVQALIALYNGTLLTLVVAPPGSVTPAATLALARCLVTGVLAGAKMDHHGQQLRGTDR